MSAEVGSFKAKLRYKTPGGRKWKVMTKSFVMSYKKFEQLSKKPSHEIIKHLFNIRKGAVDYFELMEVRQ